MAEPSNVTADELLAMGTEPRCELVRGKVIEMAPSGGEHGAIAARIACELSVHAKTHGSGRVYVADVGFVLHRGPDTVRAPDVAFVVAARVVRSRKFLEGPPDLAVEVVSPDDRASGVRAKVHEYLAAGARLVWVVDPETRTASVYRHDGSALELGEDGVLEGEDLLPGLSIELAELFAD